MTNAPLYIDIHALQTVPPSCINRDDTGSPKTARFGGVRRARVSSQAWKKAMRDEFENLLDESVVGWRTKDVINLIAEQVKLLSPELDDKSALDAATASFKATGIKLKGNETEYLLFISPLQVEALAKLGVAALEQGSKVDAKEAKTILNVRQRPTLNAVDVALFGRMVADDPTLNVDAAVQVAHALSIDASDPEFDYYTAMDDRSPEDNAGAGMIGTVEFLSATFYRYATIDVRHLYENLGSVQATKKAVEAFLRAFAVSMPTGKQNTFANRTLPSAVLVQARRSQPVSLVNAFDRPVSAYGDKSQLAVACERLIEQERAIDGAFGVAPERTWAVAAASDAEKLGEIADVQASLEESISQIAETVEAYLSEAGFTDEGVE